MHISNQVQVITHHLPELGQKAISLQATKLCCHGIFGSGGEDFLYDFGLYARFF